ncbi:unnamed protein product, partial [marine sediment metagenome]
SDISRYYFLILINYLEEVSQQDFLAMRIVFKRNIILT